jgi:hydrogenase-4 component B
MTGAGLPFTSGFVSEWLIFQTLFLTGMMVDTAWVKLIAFLGVAVLALTAGIAVATFVKLFGVAFLALPRSPQSKSAREVNRPMLTGMGLAAAGCVLLGISPWLGLSLIMPGVRQLGIGNLFFSHPLLGIMTVNNAVSPLIALVIVAAIAGIAWWFCSRSGWKTGPTWNCGTALQPQMEYSGTSFAKMGRLAFRFILRPKRQVIEESRSSRLFPGPLEYRSELPSHFEEKLYKPGTKLVLWLSEKVRLLQAGSIKLYLSYILAVLIILLLYLRLGY